MLRLKQTDIRDGVLWIVQTQTGARPGIEITGELAAVIARINDRPRRAIGAYLVQDENGQPLSQFVLRSRFGKARTVAGVQSKSGLGFDWNQHLSEGVMDISREFDAT